MPVAVVSRMMGHASEAIAQSIYPHEIRRRDSGEPASGTPRVKVSAPPRGGRDALGPVVHYSLLATVEAIFNLGTLGRNDTSATPMSDLFRGGIP